MQVQTYRKHKKYSEHGGLVHYNAFSLIETLVLVARKLDKAENPWLRFV
jgi:hypothetical protein